MHILLVEDNELNIELMKRILAKENYDVSFARNGQEAVDYFQTNHFDLILMDVQMPVMNGLEACRNIREIEKTTGEHIPIVALTAHSFGDTIEECFAVGMDSFVTKPVKPAILREEILRYKKD